MSTMISNNQTNVPKKKRYGGSDRDKVTHCFIYVIIWCFSLKNILLNGNGHNKTGQHHRKKPNLQLKCQKQGKYHDH